MCRTWLRSPQTMLIVMSGADNAGGLVLAASPLAKKVLGISNVTRKDKYLITQI